MKHVPSMLAALFLIAPAARAVTLEACIDAAISDNPGLEAATRRADAARSAITQARAAWWPRIGAGANVTRTDNPPQAFMSILNQQALSLESDFNNPDDTENLRLSAGATWRLFDPQRPMNNELAKQNAQAYAALEDAARNDLVHQVTRAYCQSLQARSFIDVQQAAVASLTESLRVAREREAAGSGLKSDALNLEVRLAETEEELIRARNAWNLGIAALNTAIGRPLATEADPPEEPARDALPLPASPGDITRRGEFQAAAATLRARDAAWRRQVREVLPTVNAFGSMDWDSDVSSDFHDSYFVGIGAELEVFDGFRRRGATAATKAERDAAAADLIRVRSDLELDLHQAGLQLTEASERLAVADKAIASAEEAFRLTGERYRQGAADVTELLVAELGFTAARTRRAAAAYDQVIARSNVLRAQGALAAQSAPKETP